LDIEGLLKSLNAHSVRYVVIGATAFPVHGYARATLDLDLFIEPTAENAARAREALVAFGYDMSDVAVDEMLVKKILIRQYMLETDLHPFVKGVSFDEVWARRVEDRIGETPAAFAGLEDLIRMKEAAGRPKDLEDLRVLRKLRDEKR
jgi:predicted nucleotidyltransferase